MTERSVGARRTTARPDPSSARVPPKAKGPTKPARAGRAWLPWTIAALGIVWLIAKLWSAYEQINANAGDTVAVATAALAIPAVVQATALGGLGGGLAVRMATDAWRVRRTGAAPVRWQRCLVAAAGGLVIGLAAMGAILGAYGDVPSIGGVAVAVALTGLIAGAVAGLGRRPVVITAALAAALGSFVVDTILNSGTVLGHMMAALGAGSDAITDCDQGSAAAACAKVVNANSLVSHIDSAVAGLAAGLVAYWYLRRRGGGARFPAYLVAGGATGVLLLATEVLTHVGGGGLLHVARAISAEDRTVIDLLAGNRIIHGLLVMFIGALAALIAFGRTLGPRRPTPAANQVTAGRSAPKSTARTPRASRDDDSSAAGQ
jgi:hypothetical protein